MVAFQISLSAIVGICGLVVTIQFNRIRHFNEAAIKFRDAFNGEFLALDPATHSSAIDACDLLEAAFHKHAKAILEFKPALSRFDAEGLEQAWQEYYRFDNAPPNMTVRGLTKYSGVGCSTGERQSRRKLARDRIERLLSYAQHRRFLL